MTSKPPAETDPSEAIISALCRRYAAELEAIAKLDNQYYLSPSPTAADRANYHWRQDTRERLRHCLYAELDGVRRPPPELFRVSLRDNVHQKTLTSSPQCTLRHDLNNYLGVVIGCCELLAELDSNEFAEGKHLRIALEMARKMVTRLNSDACPMQSRGDSCLV